MEATDVIIVQGRGERLLRIRSARIRVPWWGASKRRENE